MKERFAHAQCDLCGSDAIAEVLSTASRVCMSSDYRVMPGPLTKLVCARCRLVRSGGGAATDDLMTRYQDEYFIGNDNYFYKDGAVLPRSKVFADWIEGTFGPRIWEGNRRVLEVGASDGRLLAEFRTRFPANRYEALELSETGADLCSGLGFPTHRCTLPELEAGGYDIIYSIAVLEHTFSPTEFLAAAFERLAPGGHLILCQPTQDVYSHDIFFVDHLYHFGSGHLKGYASKCGFTEEGVEVGHGIVPGFSLHLWRKQSAAVHSCSWEGGPAETRAPASFHRIMGDIAQLDILLRELRESGRPAAVFGVNELFSLLHIYSHLRDYPIACGLDDQPDKPAYARFDFLVVPPELCREMGVEDVLLTMNRAHYSAVLPRLARLGLKGHKIFQ